MSLMDRNRPYTGQPHTTYGERGKTEIKGITFRDLRDCFIRAVMLSGYEVVSDEKYNEAKKGPDANLSEKDLYGFDLDKLDPGAIANNLSCEVEQAMGIYPNVPAFVKGKTIEETLANIGAPMISLETAAGGGLDAVMESPEMSADAVEWKARAIALWNLLDQIVMEGSGGSERIDEIAGRRHAILHRDDRGNLFPKA